MPLDTCSKILMKSVAIGNRFMHIRVVTLKRVFDFVAVCAVCMVILPIMTMIGLMIKATSPGPIFFRQKRVGLNKRGFRIYKFRSMVEGAEQMSMSVTWFRLYPSQVLENGKMIWMQKPWEKLCITLSLHCKNMVIWIKRVSRWNNRTKENHLNFLELRLRFLCMLCFSQGFDFLWMLIKLESAKVQKQCSNP